MLRLDIISQDPAADAAMWGIGVVLLLIVAAVLTGVWVVVALGSARRSAQDFDESASDPRLEALRQRRLVVRGRHRRPGQPETVVAQLEKVRTPETTGSERG